MTENTETLQMYEELFAHRFSSEDPEFQEYLSRPADPPPIVEDWRARGGGNQRGRDNRYQDRHGHRGRGWGGDRGGWGGDRGGWGGDRGGWGGDRRGWGGDRRGWGGDRGWRRDQQGQQHWHDRDRGRDQDRDRDRDWGHGSGNQSGHPSSNQGYNSHQHRPHFDRY